jgi:hypothetical protein
MHPAVDRRLIVPSSDDVRCCTESERASDREVLPTREAHHKISTIQPEHCEADSRHAGRRLTWHEELRRRRNCEIRRCCLRQRIRSNAEAGDELRTRSHCKAMCKSTIHLFDIEVCLYTSSVGCFPASNLPVSSLACFCCCCCCWFIPGRPSPLVSTLASFPMVSPRCPHSGVFVALWMCARFLPRGIEQRAYRATRAAEARPEE